MREGDKSREKGEEKGDKGGKEGCGIEQRNDALEVEEVDKEEEKLGRDGDKWMEEGRQGPQAVADLWKNRDGKVVI